MSSLVQSLVDDAAARDPLTAIRIELAKAEADLSGLIARVAAGHDDLGPKGVDPIKLARKVSQRVFALRNALDEARLARLPFERINGRRLSPNDADDMGDALHHALYRIRLGIDDSAKFRGPPITGQSTQVANLNGR